mmetsp:Transcript_45735/g.103521  ORF Transcript_45735/g.103521 Transcript_45735/m.103521 type:complete len:509 (-) Transcript_45735:62-1588(-)
MKRESEDVDLGGGKRMKQTGDHTVIRILVPADTCSFVVGSKGSHIARMRETGCDVKLMESETPPDILGHKILQIHPMGYGDRQACLELLMAAYLQKMRSDDPDQKLLVLSMEPSGVCGGVIGAGGSTINTIASSSGAKIDIDKSSISTHVAYRRFCISGRSDHIIAALTMIRDTYGELATENRISDDEWFLPKFQGNQSNQGNPVMMARPGQGMAPPAFPAPARAVFPGRPAAPARPYMQVERSVPSGGAVQIAPAHGSMPVELELILSPAQGAGVLDHMQYLAAGAEATVDTTPNDDWLVKLGHTVDVVGEAMNRLVEACKEASPLCPLTLSIPSDKMGLVMGKGGHMVQQISRETGCKIQKNNEDNHTPLRRVFFVGDVKQTTDAVSAVISILAWGPKGPSSLSNPATATRAPHLISASKFPNLGTPAATGAVNTIPVMFPAATVRNFLRGDPMVDQIADQCMCRIRFSDRDVNIDGTMMTTAYLAGTARANGEAVRLLQEYLTSS